MMTASTGTRGSGGDTARTGAPQDVLLCAGDARFDDAELAAIARREGQPAAWMVAFARFGAVAPARATGDFAVALRLPDGRTLVAVDRFATHPLCFRIDGDRIHVASRADELGGVEDFDPQAVFDYLYFHVIPAPRTIFRNVGRVPAGHCATFEHGTLELTRWWRPVFAEGRRAPLADLRAEFLRLLTESVAAQLTGEAIGCFLSGGTDSSTVAGIVGRVSGARARTFSIGFDAPGYDEMHYARIAAQHFGTDHHEYYVTPDDVTRSVPAIAAACDQPFGNSSIIPAYFCARLARDSGVERMLAGDGGDELFAGNTRYATQAVFDFYARIPEFARTSFVEPGLALAGRARLPGAGRAASYVEQTRMSLPERLERHNLLMRLGLSEVLTPDFIASVDPQAPRREQQAWYAACAADSTLNRTLAFDWKYTLADNDLPKVVQAATLAGVTAAFPLLDSRLVEFSLRLDPALKLKGTRLRWFFKHALRDFLPAAIIRKRKHGFGLPFGVWLMQHRGLRDAAFDALSSLRTRGLVRPEFIDRLLGQHLATHPSYYGEMVWIMTMYEQWLRVHAGARAATARDGTA